VIAFNKNSLKRPPLVKITPINVINVKDVSKINKSAKNPVATPTYPKSIISEGFFKLLAIKIKVIAKKPVRDIAKSSKKNYKL
jgi:hypothetical protein